MIDLIPLTALVASDLSTTYASNAIITTGANGVIVVNSNITVDNSGSFNAGGSITAGTGLTVTSGGITATGSSQINGNLAISGNLVLQGNTIVAQSNVLVISDPMIYLAESNPANLIDIGIVGSYTTDSYKHTGFVFNHTDSKWHLFDNLTIEPSGTIDWSATGLRRADIVIGNVNVTATTSSTSTTTGSIKTSGGVGIAGDLNVGGNSYFNGSITTSGPSGNISGVNNLSAVTIVSSGNVGIGSTPYARLQVTSNDTSTTIGSSTAKIVIQNSNGGSLNQTAGLEFNVGTGALDISRLAGVYGVYEKYNATALGGALVFATNPEASTTIQERMRIDSSGNVSIGTTSTTYKLAISSANAAGTARFTNTNASYATDVVVDYDPSGGGVTGSIALSARSNGDVWVKSNNASGNMLLMTGGANERLRIDSAGRVGIGATPSVGYSLQVGGKVTGAINSEGVGSVATVQSDVTNRADMFFSYPSTLAASFTLTTLNHFFAAQNTIGSGSAVTNQMGFSVDSSLTGATNNYGFYSNIASGTKRWNFYAAGTADNYFAGNVGIGAAPSNKLTVQGASGSAVYGNFSNGTNNLLIGLSAGGVPLVGSTTNDPVLVYTNNAERMRIDSSGNVGIGSSSPVYKLDVAGTAHVTGAVTLDTALGVASGGTGLTSLGTGVTTALGNAVNGSGGLITYSTYAPASGKTLTVSNTLTLAGTDSTTMTFPSASASIGYLNVPQSGGAAKTSSYTGVLSDSGKMIIMNGSSLTFTIPANGSVAYDVGTVLTVINTNASSLSIAITTDTLTLVNSTTTGTRTLAQNGMATAIKVSSTSWLISGAGLT